MSLQGAMKAFGYIGSFFLAIQQIILGPVLKVCTALAAMVKLFTAVGAVNPAPEGTDINVVGKHSPGYSDYVQTTGIDADDASDVKEMLHGVRRLNTVGIMKGSAGSVITTCLRSRARD